MTVIANANQEESDKLESQEDTTPFRESPKITPLLVLRYTLSLALLIFSAVLTHSLIFHSSTSLSAISPYLALFILWGALIWLGMMEGQQASLMGLTGVVDHLVYRDSHPRAWRGISIAYRGDNLDRYVTGRQFMVLICLLIINLSGAPLPTVTSSGLAHIPPIVESIFSTSGLAMILMTTMFAQLPPQVITSHCMIDFIDNYLALFTLYTALIIEFSGVMHASYLIQYLIAGVSGKPINSQEEPRNRLQAAFFWTRVLMSLIILGFSVAVTVTALSEGKTTMWKGVPTVVSIVLFFILLAIAGMLEGLQIAFLATSKMKKDQRSSSFFSKKTVDLLSNKSGHNLPAFLIGRQLLVVGCFFVLARVTTPNVAVGQGENIFGVSDQMQLFLNTGLLQTLLTTILGSITWKLAASAFPVAFVNMPLSYVLLWIGLILEHTGICSGAWVFALLMKKILKLEDDEAYVGTPENPVLSQDALDAMRSSDALDMQCRSHDALDDLEMVEESAIGGRSHLD